MYVKVWAMIVLCDSPRVSIGPTGLSSFHTVDHALISVYYLNVIIAITSPISTSQLYTE